MIEDAIGNVNGNAKDPRIIGGTPEEMAKKDVVIDAAIDAAKVGTPAPALKPELSETPVVEGEQAGAPVARPMSESKMTDVRAYDLSLCVSALERRIDSLTADINELHARIDRIVAAISHSKSVKGL